MDHKGKPFYQDQGGAGKDQDEVCKQRPREESIHVFSRKLKQKLYLTENGEISHINSRKQCTIF